MRILAEQCELSSHEILVVRGILRNLDAGRSAFDAQSRDAAICAGCANCLCHVCQILGQNVSTLADNVAGPGGSANEATVPRVMTPVPSRGPAAVGIVDLSRLPAEGAVADEQVMKMEIPVRAPYRLDLTVSALRRTATNLVDVYTGDGRYLRALGGFARPVIVSVAQPRVDALAVSIGVGREPAHASPTLAVVRRMLGLDCDLSDFHRHAREVRWLSPLARRMRGLRPPRYPTLFEACANAILFQQVSLQAASAIMRRLIIAIATRVEHDGVPLAVFPSVEQFLDVDETVIHNAGVSAGKFATLRRAAKAIANGELSEALLDERSSTDAAILRRGIKGIGPWTAAVILLRGLGRLDMFPGNEAVWRPTWRGCREELDARPLLPPSDHNAGCCTSVCCLPASKPSVNSAHRPP